MEEIRRTYEEQVCKMIESNSRLEEAVVQAKAHSSAEFEGVATSLQEELAECRRALERESGERQRMEGQLQELEREVLSSREWILRARAALEVLARAAILGAERYRTVCHQKIFLHEQSRLSTRLQAEAWALALAVSGGYESAPAVPPAPGGSRKSLGSASVSFRSAVIAVLFANRLTPKFRTRLAVEPDLALSGLGDGIVHHLPPAGEMSGKPLRLAAALLIRQLTTTSQWPPEGESGPTRTLDSLWVHDGDEDRSLLACLVRGERSHRLRLQDRDRDAGLAAASGEASTPQEGFRHVAPVLRWDPAGRWAMQTIRKGFLAMGRSLSHLGELVEDCRRENQVVAGMLEEQHRESGNCRDAAEKDRELLRIMQERLELSEKERAEMVSAVETHKLAAALDTAEESGRSAISHSSPPPLALLHPPLNGPVSPWRLQQGRCEASWQPIKRRGQGSNTDWRSCKRTWPLRSTCERRSKGRRGSCRTTWRSGGGTRCAHGRSIPSCWRGAWGEAS